MSLLNDDDLVVCHRAGYSNITPQACLERHLKNKEACGKCQKHVGSLLTMIDATEKDADEIIKIAQAGQLNRHANPLVNTAVKADWERGPIVNTHIIFINGIRVAQGFAKEIRPAGGTAERFLNVVIAAEAIEKITKGIREIFVDEYLVGRITYRFEWSATNAKMTPVDGKNGEKLFSFRCIPVTIDTFTKG
jgi:hypothetical protein